MSETMQYPVFNFLTLQLKVHCASAKRAVVPLKKSSICKVTLNYILQGCMICVLFSPCHATVQFLGSLCKCRGVRELWSLDPCN